MAEQAANWDVHVLEFARSKDQPWVDLISGMYHDGVMDLPFSFVLARQGNRNILIDTGFMQDDSSYSRKFGIPAWISPLRMLEELGVSAASISDIFITHAHFDHMGSIGEFPEAALYIQKSELLSWYEAIALPKRFAHLTAIIDPDNLRQALEASIEHRVTLVDGDKDNVLPGIHVRLGSGHTIGQQFVLVDTPAGRRVRATGMSPHGLPGQMPTRYERLEPAGPRLDELNWSARWLRTTDLETRTASTRPGWTTDRLS